jgi:hypothetical protein
VIVVEQRDAGTYCLENQLLVRRPHDVPPRRQASFFGHVLEYDRAHIHESPSGDWAILRIQDGRVRTGRCHPALLLLCRGLALLGRLRLFARQRGGDEGQGDDNRRPDGPREAAVKSQIQNLLHAELSHLAPEITL